METVYYKEECSLLNCEAKCTTDHSKLGGALPRQKPPKRSQRMGDTLRTSGPPTGEDGGVRFGLWSLLVKIYRRK